MREDSHKLMFFLETSGSSALTIRQACALESAARKSGRKVFLLMTSDTLNVCAEQVLVQKKIAPPNISFQMKPLLSVPNLLVVHINHTLLVEKTPLQAMFDDGRVDGTCCKTIHLSDIFRLAVLFR